MSEIYQGKAIVDRLDISALKPGEHHLWFRATPNGLGQDQLLPVSVFKAAKEGSRVLVSAGIHGDELNGVLTAQQIMREAGPKIEQGALIVLPMINLSGVLHHTRDFIPSDPDASPVNLNRHFPGKQNGNGAQRFLHAFWNNLLMGNIDYCLDLHTQTRGATYPLYVFADYRIPAALNMARWMQPDVILNDPGDTGVFETVLNEHDIPTITVEVGAGKIHQPELVSRAVEGIKAVLGHFEMMAHSAAETSGSTIEGDTLISVRAETGGMAIPEVELGDYVEKGTLICRQFDAFGHPVKEYHAPDSGHVLSVMQDPLREPGTLLVRLIK
ncbi:succinylglutamate desuccinylase/aspartoacylase family protein [Endozoicomonadaceae bacterium StTr2]